MIFDDAEDLKFLSDRLCTANESLDRYSKLFDTSHSPAFKRAQFNTARRDLIAQLTDWYGSTCMLQLDGCRGGAGSLTVDHIIPLSSNELNRNRGVESLPGRKVATQSIGSNQIANLVFACAPCNGTKKHKFLPPTDMRRVLAFTSRLLDEAS